MKKIALTATLTAAVIGAAAAAAFGGMTTAMPFAEQSEIYAVTSYATADANDSNSDMQDTAPVPLLIVTGEGQYIAEADGGAFYANITALSDSSDDAEMRCVEKTERAKEAFSPYGETTVISRSAFTPRGGQAGAYCKFVLSNMTLADDARAALIAAGAENVSDCEYSCSDDGGRAKALAAALDSAKNAAEALGGGRLVKAEESYCYADGYGEAGKVIYRAAVRATFVTIPHEKEARIGRERSADKDRDHEEEHENNGNIYIIKS